jgi:D-alanyl-D-alanine-carboxypeptidase/D-alanyl-D-alanine-endopeptidase
MNQDCAAVVLVNVTLDSRGSFADRLGQHIKERCAGKPAMAHNE